MAIVLDPNESAIRRGIKTVGVGKKGSKDLNLELALEIAADLKANKVSEAAKGAFVAGLCAKGLEGHDLIAAEALLPALSNVNTAQILESLIKDEPYFIQSICRQLLAGQSLDKKTAYNLGQYLYSDNSSKAVCGWIASFLRVRYETDEEYAGLALALEDTLTPAFKVPAPSGEPIIQMAEPFDGVDHSSLITPLVAMALQKDGYRVVHQVGRNSGPKFGVNLWDLAQALDCKPSLGNEALKETKPLLGWFFLQALISPALDRWVDLRHQTVKRPFLATIERFINPLNADICIASAFHPPYGEKMLTLAEAQGFQGIIIVRNGVEGSIAFPLLRDVKLLISKKNKHGQYQRQEMIIENPKAVEIEEKIDQPNVVANAQLIKNYLVNGSSGSEHVDCRLKTTVEGLRTALEKFKDK